jgi:hypothetical protein
MKGVAVEETKLAYPPYSDNAAMGRQQLPVGAGESLPDDYPRGGHL